MSFFRKVKLVFIFLFGFFIKLIFYRRLNTKSVHFKHIGSIGWYWILKSFFWQKIIRINNHVPWPVSPKISVVCPENIVFHPNDLHNFMTQGNYFQALDAKLIIGEGTYIAPNVGIITENHDIKDPAQRAGGKSVIIGKKCWIGFNSVILPGVVLGDHTVVGAGAIVTKSFPDGYCVIAGNPAKKLIYK